MRKGICITRIVHQSLMISSGDANCKEVLWGKSIMREPELKSSRKSQCPVPLAAIKKCFGRAKRFFATSKTYHLKKMAPHQLFQGSLSSVIIRGTNWRIGLNFRLRQLIANGMIRIYSAKVRRRQWQQKSKT